MTTGGTLTITGRRIDEAGRPTDEARRDESALQEIYPGYRGVDDDYVHAGTAALERWWDLKFGIRIHLSLYAITGTGPESWPLTRPGQGASPAFREQYEELSKWWNPTRFDAGAWADLFVRAGLKFFTFTTKHHDGFSMYDTKTRVKRRRVHAGVDAGAIVDCDLAYGIMESPCGRDLTRELVDAARARGLRVGLYYSHIDWFDADFRIDEWNYQRDPSYTRASDPAGYARMIARHREQIRELCTDYGEVDLLSLDMHFPDDAPVRDDIVETIKMARRLQPEMLIRRRGIDPYGDYRTPERVVPDDPTSPAAGLDMPWQVIYPGSKHFSHVWSDEYKPASWIVSNLIDIASKGGNFQVGYGPGPDGTFDPGIVRELEATGEWLAVNGEGIYATRPRRIYKEGERVRYTRSKDKSTVYAFVLADEDGKAPHDVELTSVRARDASPVTMLGSARPLSYAQDDRALRIKFPEELPCAHAWAFKIEVEEEA